MNEGCDGCVSKERMSNGSSATQWQILERFWGITKKRCQVAAFGATRSNDRARVVYLH